MVVTSRGGVGCCWVNSLVSLTDYDSFLFGAASTSRGGHLDQPHVHEISQGSTCVNNQIIRFEGALFFEARRDFVDCEPIRSLVRRLMREILISRDFMQA
jgi:hypothetical protein